jgi:hypothetical protein
MKKKVFQYPLLMAVILLLLAAGCGKVLPEFLHFNLPIPSQKLIVPPIPDTGTVSVSTPPVALNLDSAVNANNQGLYSIYESTLVNGSLTTDSTHNFDAIKSVEVFFTSPTLGDKLLAYNENVDMDTHIISLTTSGLNMLPYLQNNKFSLKITASARHRMLDTMSIHTNFKFDITLKKD